MATTLNESHTLLDDLFRDYPVGDFIEQFFYRLPFSLPDAAQNICEWGSWDTLSEILSDENGPDVLAVRANELRKDKLPQTAEAARRLATKGYTTLIRHAERHHDGIAQLAIQFSEAFQGPVDCHIYATPPKQFGFSWHYDAEDVFILQLSGAKEYSLRKNTVNPWPLEENLPADMQYERELMPLMRVRLRAGDMLYIPCGYWHRGTALDDDTAISLAIGVMSPTAISVLDLLRSRLRESILWRQRLPIVPSGEKSVESDAIYAQLLESLAVDLQNVVCSGSFREELIRSRLQHSTDWGS
jgi:50S ribosomal protein L16 3-hydroxylase